MDPEEFVRDARREMRDKSQGWRGLRDAPNNGKSQIRFRIKTILERTEAFLG